MKSAAYREYTNEQKLGLEVFFGRGVGGQTKTIGPKLRDTASCLLLAAGAEFTQPFFWGAQKFFTTGLIFSLTVTFFD